MQRSRYCLLAFALVGLTPSCESSKLTGTSAAAGPRDATGTDFGAGTGGSPGSPGAAGSPGSPGSSTDPGVNGVKVAVGGQEGIPGVSTGTGPNTSATTDEGPVPAGTTCASADPSIAYINPTTCIVTGLKPGTTQAKITNGDGTSHTVPVVVTAQGTDGANGGTAGVGNPSVGSGGGVSTDGLTTQDAALVAAIPGVETIQVGVNYEDSDKPSNWDWNDAVLCFNGHFKIDGTNVVSIADQTVTATTSSISGCQHQLRISVVHLDGSTVPDQVVDSSTGNIVPMSFKVGDKLETFMTSTKGPATCHDGVEVSQHSTDFGRVDAKVMTSCNTSGN